MSYEEAMDATVSRAEAVAEIKAHQIDPQEFFDEVGDRDEYQGSEVLNWLGW